LSTRGGPWFADRQNVGYADPWRAERATKSKPCGRIREWPGVKSNPSRELAISI
jgi:hypothetical protein